jgi:hypothetical protein
MKTDAEVALVYAQKYSDAGSQVITLIFALAFGIYVLLAQNKEARSLLVRFWKIVLGISVVGNAALAFALCRFVDNELKLLNVLTTNKGVIEPIKSAFELRLGFLAANFLIYAVVLGLVVYFTLKGLPSTPGANPRTDLERATPPPGPSREHP